MAVRAVVTRTITAENQFSDALTLRVGEKASISINSTAISATLHVQRTFDGGTTWLDVKSYTANAQETYEADEPCSIRIGCKTGNFTSQTALVVRLGK